MLQEETVLHKDRQELYCTIDRDCTAQGLLHCVEAGKSIGTDSLPLSAVSV